MLDMPYMSEAERVWERVLKQKEEMERMKVRCQGADAAEDAPEGGGEA